MRHVMPVLTSGLMEVCKVRPTDPVDYLAEFLFRHAPAPSPLDRLGEASSGDISSRTSIAGSHSVLNPPNKSMVPPISPASIPLPSTTTAPGTAFASRSDIADAATAPRTPAT
jgi:adenylate kinase